MIYYPRPAAALPDILMLDFRNGRHASAQLLSRYHPIFIETIHEQREIDLILDGAPNRGFGPGLIDGRRSVLPIKHITIAQYQSAGRDWPYVLLCHWPPKFTRPALQISEMLSRGAYTVDLFRRRDELERASALLVGTLEKSIAVAVEIVPADLSVMVGSRPH